ncbi:MAG: hypothetical protein FWE67_15990, partial [Planctomycetaceae bacterium]|nr:hypothetical protein [Planctomycetaceae bacterium]
VGTWLRRSFYFMLIKNAPTDVSVGFGSVFSSENIQIEKRVSIGGWCSVNRCRIGSGTLIGSHVDIFSGRYQHGNFNSITENKESNPYLDSNVLITIGCNVWIGNGCIVCADVGDNSIIGAGAVVVKEIPSNCVAVGNPARVIKQKYQNNI